MSRTHTDLNALLQEKAQAQAGFLPFDALMEHALYAPNLGYYASTRPVGSASQGGDFTTAPQISALFGHTLARAIAPLFRQGLAVNLLECGAGTGQLAVDVLTGLQALGLTVNSYSILEVSTSLRQQQKETLLGFERVVWLDRLPEAFEGVVLGNEVLDAMPFQAFETQFESGRAKVFERGVVWSPDTQAWVWAQRAASPDQAAQVCALLQEESLKQTSYQLEIGTQAQSWVRSMAASVLRGAVLLVDYGFPQAELYHPQRATGTLMAHHRHRANTDVLADIGAADITAHVDFTAIAQAGQAAGLTLLGYTSQARFLINAGIADAYAQAQAQEKHDSNEVALAKLSRGLQYLMSEAEMGELFKVICFGKNCPSPEGFAAGDRSHRLNDHV